MGAALTPQLLIQGGATLLLASILLTLLGLWARGGFHTAKSYSDMRTLLEDRVRSAEEREKLWREAYISEKERADLFAHSHAEMLEQGRTTIAALEAIAAAAERPRPQRIGR